MTIKFSGCSFLQMLVLDLTRSQNISWNLPQGLSWFEDDEFFGNRILIVGKEGSLFLQTCNEEVQKRIPAFRSHL